MIRRVKYSLCLLSAFAVLAAAGQTIAALSASDGADKPACEVLRDWARPYANTQPTLGELARLDRAHRIAIFNAVTPEVRSALWQEQLERFSQRADLSATQRELIAEARTILTPSLYRRDQAAQRAAEQFRPRIEAAFTSAEHRSVWFDLGSVIPVADGAADSAIERSTGTINGTAYGAPCHCWSHAPSAQCATAPCNPGGCTGQMSGCGMFGDRPCDGLCGSR